MARRSRGILLAVLAVVSTAVALSPSPSRAAAAAPPAAPEVIIRESPGNASAARASAATLAESSAPPADAPVAMATTPTANFVVTYDSGFNANPSAKAAFQSAIDTWARIVKSPIPIKVSASFVAQGPGTLGSASAILAGTDFTNGVPNTWYPRAMAEAIAGRELMEFGQPYEITSNFNSTFPDFYFGTDGNPPSNKIDFESVVLHELGHGLGHIDFTYYGGDCPDELPTSTKGCYPYGYMIFDRFTRTVGGTPLPSMPSPSNELGAAITTPNNVVFDGPATNAIGGPATLYTPNPYENGSSVGHLASTVYDFTSDSLMTPSLTRGEVARPRQIVVAQLRDMGFPMADASLYQPMQPARLLDTRIGNTPIGPNSAIDLKVTGTGVVPATGVDAVVLNVTSTESNGGGYFTVWPTGQTRPVASNLNFTAGQTIANLVIAKVGAGGFVSIYNAFGNTHAVVDINGWVPTGASYTPVTPNRLIDTRGGPGIASATPLELNVVGGDVPPTATAVVLNVTATEGTASSFFTVWPTGQTRPTASNLNFIGGQTVPNLVLAKIGMGNKVSIYNHSGTAHAVVDVQGYLSAAGDIVPLTPARLLDSRVTPPAIPAGSFIELVVTGVGGVPKYGVAAVVLNVTATAGTASSYLTVWPKGLPRPTASNLNFLSGADVPNLVVAKVGSEGKVRIYNHAGSSHVVVDVMGYSR